MDIFKMGESNPNYLGSWDIPANKTITLTIAEMKEEMVVGNGGLKEKCAVCHFSEPVNPMIFNAENKKRLYKLFETRDSELLRGKKVKIGVEKVKAFGDIHDALRIKKELVSEETEQIFICSDCKKKIEAANGLNPEQLALYTEKKYGRKLCAVCATAQAQKG